VATSLQVGSVTSPTTVAGCVPGSWCAMRRWPMVVALAVTHGEVVLETSYYRVLFRQKHELVWPMQLKPRFRLALSTLLLVRCTGWSNARLRFDPMHLVCLDAFGFDFSVPKINRHCYRSDMRERPPAVRQQPGYRQSSLPGRGTAHGSWSLPVEGRARKAHQQREGADRGGWGF